MSSSHLSDKRSDEKQTDRGLPIEPLPEAQVYNLTVLVQTGQKSGVSARAANLSMPEVEASTIREALSLLVTSAKKVIGQRIASSDSIPWIEPPNEPAESESRYVVPLHL